MQSGPAPPAKTFLRALGGCGPIAADRVALVVAHPDDETIGAGGLLARLQGVTIVHVTDGAPRNLHDARAHGFPSSGDYAAARRREVEDAVAIAGVPPSALVRLDVPDQGAAFGLADIARRLAVLFAERGTAIVLTHAYEGGHPDHDAVAYAVHQACRRLARSSHSPAVIEMPFYHAAPEGWMKQRFIPHPDRPETKVMLDEGARARKARMLAAHVTQAGTLAGFALEAECFREAAVNDFADLPNGGDLLYARYEWGMTGERWLALVREADAALGREDPPP